MENGKGDAKSGGVTRKGSAELDRQLLLEASEGCDCAACRRLLDQGADVNGRDEDGCSSLLWAVLAGSEETVKLFLERGAEVNVSNLDGETPLHWAAVTGKLKIAELLLARGAKADAKDVFGITPLRSASLNGDWKMVKLLREHGGS